MNDPKTKANTDTSVLRGTRRGFLALLPGMAVAPLACLKAKGDDDGATEMRWDLIDFSATPVVTANPGGHASAKANDDSMITMTGSGTFLVSKGVGLPNHVTGGGTWETFDPQGNSTDSGTYKATSLLRWEESPGSLSVVPGAIDNIGNIADTHAGLLVLRIEYSDGNEGTLLVSCDLPGAPEEVFEGVTPTKGFVAYWNRIAPVGADNRTLFHALPRGSDHD